jgi:hypothetical protein
MAPKKRIKDVESMRKRVNDPNFLQSDNVEKFMNLFSNRSIVVKRGLTSMLSNFKIDKIFDYMGWHNFFKMTFLSPNLFFILR